MKYPYILCAAIWFNDNKKYEHQPKNIDIGIVICGRRHHNCFLTAFALNGGMKIVENVDDDIKVVQGFMTSDNRFVDRSEAAQIAMDAEQIDFSTSILISEDLY